MAGYWCRVGHLVPPHHPEGFHPITCSNLDGFGLRADAWLAATFAGGSFFGVVGLSFFLLLLLLLLLLSLAG